jgi:tape measure domain-containing protein
MANAGFATLQVIPSLRGIDSSLTRQLNGKMGGIGAAAGAAAGRSLSTRLASSALSGLDSFGARITSTVSGALRKGLTFGAAAVTGIAGFSLFGGLGRLLDTEDATVQLRRMGLGISEIDTLLAAVDTTFSGTPFANPDGFNISSQLFASGRSLEEIPGILGNIADLATHGNVPIEQMGSLFTRIASQGRVTGEELNRLSDANIPLTVLADTMGITVDELRTMASEGKLTSDVFFDAIEQVEMFDGAAKSAGDTTRGAWANMKTALKKLGADFLGPLFGENGHAVQGLKAITEGIKGMAPRVKELGQRFADWLVPTVKTAIAGFRAFAEVLRGEGTTGSDGFVGAMERIGLAALSVVDIIRGGIQWYKDNADAIKRVLEAAVPAGIGIAGLATAVHLLVGAWRILSVATPIGLLLLLASALVYAWQNSEKFREIVTAAFEKVKAVVGPIIETVSGWINGLFGGGGSGAAAGATAKLTGAWERVRDVAAAVWPEIQRILQAFGGWLQTHFGPLFSAVGELVVAMWERLKAVIPSIVAFLQGFWERHGERIVAILTEVGQLVRRLFERAIAAVTDFIELLAAVFRGDWARVWEEAKSIFSRVWENIVDNVKTIGPLLLAGLKALGGLALTGLQELGGLVLDGIKKLPAALGALGGLLLAAGEALLNGLWQGIQAVWDDPILPFIKSLPGLALVALGALGSFLLRKGQDLLSGLWNGIQNVWNNTIKPWLVSLGATALLAVPSLLLTLLSRGKQLLNGVMNGIRDVWNNTIKPWLVSLGTTALLAVPSLLGSLLSRGKQLLNGVWNGISEVWNNTIKPWLGGLPSLAASTIGLLGTILKNKGHDLLAGLYNGVIGLWNDLVRPWLTGTGSRIADAIGSLGGVLYSAGRAVITGLWDGMKSVWGNVTSWLGDRADIIPIFKGPPAYDAKVLVNSGRLIMQGFQDGLAAGWSETESMLRGMSASIDGNFRDGARQAAGGSPHLAASVGRVRDGDVIMQSYEQNPTPAGGAAMIRMAMSAA